MAFPPVLLDSMQRALERGTFFSNDSLFGHFLPRPEFPREQRTSMKESFDCASHLPRIEPFFGICSDCNDEVQIHTTHNFWNESSKCGHPCEQELNAKKRSMDTVCEWKSTRWNVHYSSEESRPPSPTMKMIKQSKIVLKAAQAKDVSILYI